MYKMIIKLCFFCIGSIVAMNKMDISLAYLDNQSGRDFIVTYGPRHQCFLANGNKVNVIHNFFTKVQSLPVAEKIVFQENLPLHYPLAACIIRTLDLKVTEYLNTVMLKEGILGSNKKHVLTIKNNNAIIKSYNFVFNTKYIFNVTINQDDELVCELIEDKK